MAVNQAAKVPVLVVMAREQAAKVPVLVVVPVLAVMDRAAKVPVLAMVPGSSAVGLRSAHQPSARLNLRRRHIRRAPRRRRRQHPAVRAASFEERRSRG
jgi:hypothetical protein